MNSKANRHGSSFAANEFASEEIMSAHYKGYRDLETGVI